MRQRLALGWQALKSALLSREFWLLLVWLLLVLAALAWLVGLAVSHFDTYLRLKPLICETGIGNRQFLVVALTAPLGLAFALSAFGELWLIREARRSGHQARWRHFMLFTCLAALGAVLTFYSLGC
jgi:hypothetical protein